MQSHTHNTIAKHRWAVAGPLAFLMIAFTVREAVVRQPLSADLLHHVYSVAATAAPDTVTDGVALYRLQPGTTLDTTSGAELQSGTALIASQQLITVRAGSLTLEGWNGAFQLTKEGDALTIAALTSPVFLRDGDHQSIVPAFMQWHGTDLAASGSSIDAWMQPRALKSLPQTYVQDQLLQLSDMQAQQSTIAPTHVASFATTGDRFLLAAFHPLVRDYARVLLAPMLTSDEQQSLLLLTAASDVLPSSIAPLALTQWQAQWMQDTQTQTGIDQFSAALPILQTQIERLDALQFPERVDTYTTALLTVAAPIEQRLTPAARHTVEDLRTLRNARRMSAPLPDTSSSSVTSTESASTSSLPAQELFADAQALLQQHNFMQTTQTTVTPAGQSVQVGDIVFGAAHGDTVLSFTLDPLTQTVSSIIRDGNSLPNALTLTQFVAWLRMP